MVAVWLLGLAGGLAVAAFASRRAVGAALEASRASRLPAGVIGLTVMAVGTDLPEIANSIAAAFGGHGDLLVGDAAGSALTQVTLILGLLCLGSTPIHADRRTVIGVGTLTTAALLVAAFLTGDQTLSRLDGAALVAAWTAAIIMVQRRRPDSEPIAATKPANGPTSKHVASTIGWLSVVGLSAMVVIESFLQVSERFGLPELITSAIVLSLGTSLPELVVDWTAIRHGAVALAIGDLFGSSLLDATLALGIGPAMRAVSVSPTAATVCIIAAMGVVAATAIAGSRPSHGRSSATLLFLVYGAATMALVVGVGVG